MHDDPVERLKSVWDHNQSCPSSQELTAFYEKSLELELMAKIRNHISRCGLCDSALSSLKGFDGPNTDTKRLPFRFLLKPAIAFLLLAALLYFTSLIFLKPSRQNTPPAPYETQAPAAVDGVDSAMMFDLGEVISKRGNQSLPVHLISIGLKERFFVLNFYLPVRADYIYEMEIQNMERQIVSSAHVIRARDAIGNFSIIVQRGLFSDGDYRAIITESEEAGKEPVDRFEFLLRIMSPATN
jgi:hypothetical protein